MADVDLIIKAVDQATNVIKGIDRQLGKLDNSLQRSQSLGVAGGLAIGAGFAAVSTAIGVATFAVGAFSRTLSEASQAQVEQLVLTGQLAELMSTTYDRADQIMGQVNDKLAETAARLPGVTSDYVQLGQQITDSLLPAARDLNGEINPERLAQLTSDIASAFLIGGKAVGSSQSQIAAGITRALGGNATLAELKRLDVFEKNPALIRFLEEELTKRGVSELKDLDEVTRITILQSISKRFLTDETVARIEQSLAGRLEGFASSIFDPTTGLLGFRNKIETRANQTVLDSVNAFVGELLDVVNVFAEILGLTGFDSNSLLESLYDFFIWLAKITNDFEQFLTANREEIVSKIEYVKSVFTGEGEGTLSGFFFNLAIELGDFFNNLVDEIDYSFLGEFAFKVTESLLSFMVGVAVKMGQFLTDPSLQFEIASEVADGFIKALYERVGLGTPDKLDLGALNPGDSSRPSIAPITSPTAPLIPTVNDELPASLTRGGGRAIGNIPTALYNAIRSEQLAAPNANPVIANDSELILNQKQIKEFLSSNRGSVTNNVYVQGILDQSIINQIVQALDRQWGSTANNYFVR